MLRKEVQVPRPQRWDVPFDERIPAAKIDAMLATAPFANMNAERFPSSCPLRGILQNDTRIRQFAAGDLVVREGEYGNSAFLVLAGAVRVTLDPLPDALLGRGSSNALSPLKTLARMIFRPRVPEYRHGVTDISDQLGHRRRGGETRIFLQDVPGVLDQHRTLRITTGEFFGELAALSRTPRSASVFADEESVLLELRWQGLRDLMRFDNALQDHIHELYRQNSLATHLRQTPLLKQLPDNQFAAFVQSTTFETYGNFEWHRRFRDMSDASPNQRIESEPLIATEGNLPNGLLLIRNGFARLSRRHGHGHRTCSYLGKGRLFGLEEIYQAWKTQQQVPLSYSLRAVGYVDILRVPAELIETHILPQLSDEQRSELESRYLRSATSPAVEKITPPSTARDGTPAETSRLEFIVENRLMNGTQAMVINLDRCTRCDDCVQACSDTHNNNPRFVRQGPIHGSLMVAGACMHCVDPVCMIGCPTGAISRNEQSGSVTIHDGSCIGCATCANSCPYEAIRMVEIRDRHGQFFIDESTQLPITKATKCDFCAGQFGGPACERACPHDALVRIDLTQPSVLNTWLAR